MNNIQKYAALAQYIREKCVMMVNGGGSGHIGSMLSMADLLAVLYTDVLRVDPKDPAWDGRDRFLLSKGHGGAAVYCALAYRGFFPEDWLPTYYRDNDKLSGHISHHVPGVEFSTGSLGHGLPVAVGMALALRQQGKSPRVFCLMSDGDCDEGSTWEAIMFAAQHKLDNLTVIVDWNRIQALGFSKDIIDLAPLTEKAAAFGWTAKEFDGHDFKAISDALAVLPYEAGRPTFLVARTVKCKGISELENTVVSHYYHVTDEDRVRFTEELRRNVQ